MGRMFLFLNLLYISAALKLSTVEEPVKDEYIIQFKNNVSLTDRQNHITAINASSVVFKTYDFPGFSGYAVVMQPKALQNVLSSPLVQLVEQNGVVRISDESVEPKACITQSGAPWGLVRSAQRDLKIDGNYKYDGTLASVRGYVIDTGIYIKHDDFGGRAVWGYNAVDTDDTDGNGHGTHCAGTMAGNAYGLHKTATLVAVKVLNAGGSGTNAGVIDGVNWVVNDAIARAKKAVKEGKAPSKAVGNMSLGGGRSTALNNAVDAAVESEVVMAVAAGNDANDACNYSPASAQLAISTGASDNKDAAAYFSNWGSCVDVYGPGVGILSAWIGGPTATNTISGTSMASPHVAGVAMKLMSENPDYDADKIQDELLALSTLDKLSGIRTSPNKLVFHQCA